MRRTAALVAALWLLAAGCSGSRTDGDAGGAPGTQLPGSRLPGSQLPGSQLPGSQPSGSPPAAGGTTTRTGAPAGRRSDRYADLGRWHCHPAKADDVCATTDLRATVVAADGRQVVEPVTAAAPAIDCFYVYPTVDTSTTPGVRRFDQPINPLETVVVQSTFAPYREVCRTFAPRYEQMTGAGYRDPRAGEFLAIGDAEVEEALDHYLATENGGRPFVLVGHSQGTHNLVRLLQRRFDGVDGAALRGQLVSALLLGPVGMIVVPTGQVVGGTFSSILLCTSARQNGCVVAYDSFASSAPPVSGAPREGMTRACTNPANLADGDQPAKLRGPQLARFSEGVTTPTEIWPDYYSARCARDAVGQPFLEISAVPATGDPRQEKVLERFGRPNLHRLDPNLAMRDLLDLVSAQAAAATD